jgi:hypothetical protein
VLTSYRKDVEKIYRYSLKGTVEVLEDQLQMAKVKGKSVQVRAGDISGSLSKSYLVTVKS